MGVVLLHILQWILRIILFLLLLIVGLVTIILIVPIRYQAEGEFLEKKPGVRGKITWFFYLVYMKFCYEEEFHIQVKVFGFKVFDSANGESKPDKQKSDDRLMSSEEETSTKDGKAEHNVIEGQKEKNPDIILGGNDEEIAVPEKVITQESSSEDELTTWEKEMEAEAKEEAERADKVIQEQSTAFKAEEKSEAQDIEQNQEDLQDAEQNHESDAESNSKEKEKKSFSEKIEGIKLKIQEIIQKIKDIIGKIQEGKLKAEHYLELWNREETQITFSRGKIKFGRMIKAILPRKWKLTGEIGFSDPCTTGQFMGVLGAMYPIIGNKVQIVPNFEEQVINIEGNLKGHIRLGNLLYQLVSLLLNRHCFKFIKMIFDELGNSKKDKNKQEV